MVSILNKELIGIMIFENAHEVLKKIKQKEVSAQEVLESFLKQVDSKNVNFAFYPS